MISFIHQVDRRGQPNKCPAVLKTPRGGAELPRNPAMTSFNFRDLCGNPDLEQAEIDAANRDDACIPFTGGLPDDVAAVMSAAFGYDKPMTDEEVAEMFRDLDRQRAEDDARRND